MHVTIIVNENNHIPHSFQSIIIISFDNPALFFRIKCIYCGILSYFIENSKGFKVTAAAYTVLCVMQHLKVGITNKNYTVTIISSKTTFFLIQKAG